MSSRGHGRAPGRRLLRLAPVPGGRLNVGIVLAGRAWQDTARPGWCRGHRRARPALDPAAPRRPRDVADGRDDRIRSRAPARSAAAWSVGRARTGCRGRCGRLPGPVHRRGPPPARWSPPGSPPRSPTRTCAAIREALRPTTAPMRDRFATKDRLSLLVQTFLARPVLFEHAGGASPASPRSVARWGS